MSRACRLASESPDGTLDNLGHSSQPGLPGDSLFWQDRDAPTSACDTVAAHAWWHCQPQQFKPGETAQGVDLDPRSGDHQWRDLCARAGTIDGQEDACTTSYDPTQQLPRDGIVQQVRLCALQNIDPHERAQDLLLPLSRLGWMEIPQRCSLQ